MIEIQIEWTRGIHKDKTYYFEINEQQQIYIYNTTNMSSTKQQKPTKQSIAGLRTKGK